MIDRIEKCADFRGIIYCTPQISLGEIDDVLPEIKKGLEEKMEAMVRRDLYTKYKTAPTEEEREKARQEYLEKVGIELKPGAIEILTYLKEKGIHRAISTANDIERAEKYLKKIGLYGYFDKIICAPMVEHGKPAPDVYEFACSELKLAPEECMAVEDSPNGVKSAYSAGCKVVMVPDLTQPDEELKKMLFACVDRIDEIKSIV